MKVETVLFDLDETLIEEEPSNDVSALAAIEIARGRSDLDPRAVLLTLRKHSRELWRGGPAFEYCNDIGISSREGLWGQFTGEHHQSLSVLREWIPSYRDEAWGRALAEHGVEDRQLARVLGDFFLADRRERHVVFPESRRVLEALRPRIKLAMITNGASDIQRNKIEGSGLAEFFDLILVSGEEGFGKPKPEIFRLAMDRLDVDEAAAVMIGDSLARDVAGAAAVGIKTIWLNRTNLARKDGFPVPDVELRDLIGLPELLETIP